MDIKIRGLGHDITLRNIDINTTKLGYLQSQVESRTNLPHVYQRILCNGKTLYPPPQLKTRTSSDSRAADAADASGVVKDETNDEMSSARESTLKELFTKLKIRLPGNSVNARSNPTMKMLLMHNASYSKDRVHIESIHKLSREIQTYETKYKALRHQQQDLGTNNMNNNDNENNDVIDDNENSKDSTIITQDEMKIIQHRIIEISCQLDAVDVSSSTSLRQMRKNVLKRLDELEQNINSLL